MIQVSTSITNRLYIAYFILVALNLIFSFVCVESLVAPLYLEGNYTQGTVTLRRVGMEPAIVAPVPVYQPSMNGTVQPSPSSSTPAPTFETIEEFLADTFPKAEDAEKIKQLFAKEEIVDLDTVMELDKDALTELG